jgi:hypothetical protein
MKLFHTTYVAAMFQRYLHRRINILNKKAEITQKRFNQVQYDVHINGKDKERLEALAEELSQSSTETHLAADLIQSIDKVLMRDVP